MNWNWARICRASNWASLLVVSDSDIYFWDLVTWSRWLEEPWKNLILIPYAPCMEYLPKVCPNILKITQFCRYIYHPWSMWDHYKSTTNHIVIGVICTNLAFIERFIYICTHIYIYTCICMFPKLYDPLPRMIPNMTHQSRVRHRSFHRQLGS